MLETASTQDALRDARVVMLEPLVRILTVMEAVYNGLEMADLGQITRHPYRARIPVDKHFSCENKQLDPIIRKSVVYNPSGEVRHLLTGISTDP
jgi:hypothetical protein